MNNSKIWWLEYRKRQNKPNPRNLSVEHVIRKTFNHISKEYINSCSVAGVKQMCDSDISFTQRFVRKSLFCIMFGGIFYFLLYLWYGNLANPLIVVMDSSTYPISKIEFPSVTICNFNRISKRALEKYLQKYNQQNTSKNNSKAFLKEIEQLGRLIDFSYNKTIVNYDILRSFMDNLGNDLDINKIMKEFKNSNKQLYLLIKKSKIPNASRKTVKERKILSIILKPLFNDAPLDILSPPCDEMLMKCSWNGKIENCSSIFKIHRTVRGHCCAFNHVVNNNSIKRSIREKFQIKRQYKPGFLYGLNVILDPMIDDYCYPLYNMHGFEILIFDSSNFGDPTSGRVAQRVVQAGYASFFEIKPVKQIATKEVRKYPAGTRKCFFYDELRHKYGSLYSYSYCIMNCRIKAVQSLCKCTPFYFPINGNDFPICNMQDLECLNKHKEKLIYLYPLNALNNEGIEDELQDVLRCSECLPDCQLTRHFIKHYKIKLSRVENRNKEFVEFYFRETNMSNKGVLSIFLGKNTGVLNRLDIVSYWYEIISNIGGFCSILVGFSIISILEFFYFFIFRFSIHLYLIYK